MLRTLRSIPTAAVLALALTGAFVQAAAADPTDDPSGGVYECDNRNICIIVTEPGGNPSPGSTTPGTGGGGGGGVQTCMWNGKQWPCWDDDLGWFNSSNGCYYKRSNPQPPAGDPEWGTHDPAKGAMYDVTCRGANDQLTPLDPQYFAAPPGGAPPPPTPLAVATELVRELKIGDLTVHAAPLTTAVVGAPVWLWYDRTDDNAGDLRKTAQGTGFSITAVAKYQGVTWDTGESDGIGGTHQVSCTGAGTPWTSGSTARSDCTYAYTTSSVRQPDTAYALTARACWTIDARVDQTGVKVGNFPPVCRTSEPIELRVGEVQVLNN
ncbi:hypothetical protein CFP65_6411 [Kitasatospora sp. MMS16-BH015]|uniref:hypothetical protein n=1 Tax=Kitasatospora sp. MMS16-BH015 TaxID=2018025 RepID=UPI000CA1DCA4|nr:hypothetical protein [Kitasatospora sp. MMS16-BH015]AUG81067.1 hypothetical protein CFP65_6411 [Kitasatospora sp. MMS16-BH015]